MPRIVDERPGGLELGEVVVITTKLKVLVELKNSHNLALQNTSTFIMFSMNILIEAK